MKNFTAHGSVTISNHGGYLIEISDCGSQARVQDSFGSENPVTSEWLDIESVFDEESLDFHDVIAPKTYNINLADVMRIQNFRS